MASDQSFNCKRQDGEKKYARRFGTKSNAWTVKGEIKLHKPIILILVIINLNDFNSEATFIAKAGASWNFHITVTRLFAELEWSFEELLLEN